MKEVTASQRKVESDSKLALEKEKLAWLREQCQESERLTEVFLVSKTSADHMQHCSIMADMFLILTDKQFVYS